MATRGRQPAVAVLSGKLGTADVGRSTLLAAVRKASAAWGDVEAAEAALARYGGDRPAKEHARVLEHLGEAKHALRAAYNALVPSHRRRTPHVRRSITPRHEPLWRCRYCAALVWESQRRAHLVHLELLRDDLWTDAQLGAHYEPEAEETDEEDELDGW